MAYQDTELRYNRQITDLDIINAVNNGIGRGKIHLPNLNAPTRAIIGGYNKCPNSDFSYSVLAATVAATSPTDPDPLNFEIYRVFRQIIGDDIGDPINDTEALAEAPEWDRVNGRVLLGSVGADIYDVAIQFTNNWLVPQRRWFISAALASIDDNPIPAGSRFFAGFWGKFIDNTEGWIGGETIELTVERRAPQGSNTFRYFLVSRTDTGFEVGSEVYELLNAPDALSEANYVDISYEGGTGFFNFTLYKEIDGVGFYKIAEVINNSTFSHRDEGDFIEEVLAFPSADSTFIRAYDEKFPSVSNISGGLRFTELAIRIPDFDTSQLKPEGTFLRLGFIGEAFSDRHIVMDTIYAGEQYSQWDLSPLDNYPSQPSTSLTTGVIIIGGGGGQPTQGTGYNCLIDSTDILLESREYLPISELRNPVENNKVVQVESGDNGKVNFVSKIRFKDETSFLKVKFSHGLTVFCTPNHRFIRSFTDNSGVIAKNLKTGDSVMGRVYGTNMEVEVESVETVEMVGVSALITLVGDSPFYAAGDGRNGIFVWNHNAKEFPDVV